MKKLSERDLWNGLKNRLNDYTEEPGDDLWDKIGGGLPPQTSSRKGAVWVRCGVGIATLLLVCFIFNYMEPNSGLEVRQNEGISLAQGAPTDADSLKNNLYANVPVDVHPGQSELNVGTRASDEVQVTKNSVASSITNPTSIHNHNSKKSNTAINLTTNQNDRITSIQTGASINDNNNYKAKNLLIESISKSQVANQIPENPYSIDNNWSDAADKLSKSEKQNASVKQLNSTAEKQAKPFSASDSLGDKNFDIDENLNNTSNRSSLSQENATIQGKRDTYNSNSTDLAEATSKNEEIIVKDKVKEKEQQKSNSKSKTPLTPAEKMKRLMQPQVYIILTPSLAFYAITPILKDEVIVSGLRSPGIFNEKRFGISFDGGVQHHITKHLEVFGGLSFYQQQQQITYEYVSVMKVDNSEDGFSFTPVMESKSFNYNMFNVGASAGMFYHLMGPKLKHKAGLALQYHKGIQSVSTESSYSNSHSSYLNYQIFYRMELAITDRLNGYFQSSFTHTIIARERLTEPFTIKQNRAGIGIGILYRFKK